MHYRSWRRSACSTRLALIASLGAAAAGAQAQQPAPAWQVARGKQYCTMSGGIGGATPLTYAFRITPGMEKGQLVFARQGGAFGPFKDREEVAVTVLPSGSRFDGWVWNGVTGKAHVLTVEAIDASILSSLTEPAVIQIAAGEDIKLKAPFPPEGGARAALQQCIDGALQEWGVDPKKFAALQRPPRLGDKGTWLTPADYPKQALASGTSGTVVVRVAVREDGRITDCDVVVSSGSSELDTTTCRTAKLRARIEPAIGADGSPTSTKAITSVRWWIE